MFEHGEVTDGFVSLTEVAPQIEGKAPESWTAAERHHFVTTRLRHDFIPGVPAHDACAMHLAAPWQSQPVRCNARPEDPAHNVAGSGGRA